MDTSKLKAIRTGHRGAATKILKRISEGCEDSVLEECLKTLTSKRDILQDLHGQIVNGLTDEEEITTDEYIINLNIQIKEHYGKIFPSKENEQEQPSRELPGEIAYHNLSANAPNYIPISSKSNHKLPKLDLSTFSGELLDWQTFWDCYDTSIHSNSGLSNVEKFSYLRSLLRGEALQAITGFALTNTNYGQAVEVLFERYGQTHRIVNAYMQNMVELPSPHDISSLKLFFDTTETYIRGLESLGVYVETYSSLLVPVILKKLPRDFLRDITCQNGSDRWDLHSLRDAIKRELRVHESANIAFEFTNNQPTTATFLTRSRHTNNEYMSKTQTAKFDLSKRPCVFCKEIHAPVDCTMSHDERIEKIKSERLCFNCLGRHKVSDCKSTNTCKKCKRKHHMSICPGDNTNTTTISASVVSMHSAISSTPQVLLKTAVAEVQSENARCESNILFDEGSQRSFITRKLADELELSTLGKETLNMSGFGSMKGEIRQLDKVQILVIGEHGQRVHLEALVVPNIGVPLRTHSSDIKSLPYLRNLKLAHGNPGNHPFEIQILIGADFYWNFVLDHVVRGSGPTAVKSKLGYLLSGPSYTSNTKDGVSIGIYNVLANHRGEEINIAKFWEIEDLPNKERMDSKSKLHEYQEKAIKDDRFTTKLPWKEEHPELPTNRNVAKQRLSSVVKRLNRETGMLKMYDNIIKDQEKRGFIEEVKEDEAENTHYIPHHPVKKDSSTTPIRIVFDCSCKETHESASLNECLETNAPQLNYLTTLLTKFRMNKYAVTTDIEKAFLQVGLEEEDRNYTRFFWLRDFNDPSSEIVTYRFKVVLFGATCSPFILHATLLKLFQDNSSTTSEELEKSLYVDNVLTSFSDEESLLSFYTEARQLLQKGGFNLRTWNSNSSRLRSQAVTDCVEDSSQNVKILGMRWNVDSDKLSYPHLDITDTTSKTKREVLSQSSKLFDPLGFLCPVTIRAKIFIQELWKQNYTWDVPLPPDITDNWNNILQDLKSATKLDIQRCINRLQDDSQGQLHIFTDASQYAYGACAYLVHGEQSILLMSKNRVAPLKTLTLPRMELMGATIGAQLCSHLQSVLNVNSVTLWCDSQIVLHWLKSDKLLKRFISKRINEIKELTGTHEWRYVPTDNNPADLQTRGIAASELLESNFWIHGPEWITSQSNWPIWNSDVTVTMMSQTQQEMEQNDEVQPGSSENSKNISPIFSLEKYSSYSKILRITAFVFRFINNCKTTTEKRTQGPIKPDELNRATKYWIRIAQRFRRSVRMSTKRKAK